MLTIIFKIIKGPLIGGLVIPISLDGLRSNLLSIGLPAGLLIYLTPTYLHIYIYITTHAVHLSVAISLVSFII